MEREKEFSLYISVSQLLTLLGTSPGSRIALITCLILCWTGTVTFGSDTDKTSMDFGKITFPAWLDKITVSMLDGKQ